MLIIPIKTPVLTKGDDLAGIIKKEGEIEDGDIVVVSSKAVATVEGRAMKLADFSPSEEAKKMSKGYGEGKPPEYFEAVLQETARMNGNVMRANYGIALTELKPDGMEGTLLVPNAGIDRSNVEGGYVIGWPKDPVESAKKMKDEIEGREGRERNIAVILTDSGLCPRRRGVTAFALCCCGIDPLISLIGTPDLFGQDMLITEEAIADQLATAANAIMGNADQCIPAAVIRDHGIELSDYCGWVPGIERERDVYHGVI